MISSLRHRADDPAWIVAAGIALLVTPVCGWLFTCGCDWPWRGLANHCNYFDPNAKLHCPWCEHPVPAAAGILLATLAGIGTARRACRLALGHPNPTWNALLGLAVALAGLLVAGVTTLKLTGQSVF